MVTQLDERVQRARAQIDNGSGGSENSRLMNEAGNAAAMSYRNEIGQDAFDLEAIRSDWFLGQPVQEVIRTLLRVQARLVEASGLK